MKMRSKALGFALVTSLAAALAAPASAMGQTAADLVKLVKANPGKFNYASGNTGGIAYGGQFKNAHQLEMTHVPYRGIAPAFTDLIAGQIHVMFLNVPAAVPYVKAGKVRAMGISTAKRSPHLPQVPSIHEAGVPGFDIDVWYGLSAPSGTSRVVIDKMHQDVTRALTEAEIRKHLIGYGADPLTVTPEEMGKRIRGETATWAKVIQRSSIRFE